jgi:hypothetical protein
MRKDQKPYRNRKPFKRKSGGGKFMLGGSWGKDVSFDIPSTDKGMMASMSSLISLILGRKKQQGVTTTNK